MVSSRASHPEVPEVSEVSEVSEGDGGGRSARESERASTGILPVDKPVGVSSFAVIRRLMPFFRGARDTQCARGMRSAQSARLGHAGTLDPAASGLLLVCIGAATRLVSHFQEMPKTYRAEVLLGTITESDDLDGKVLETRPVPGCTDAELQALYARFTGVVMQRPPAFSALKIDGVRAYTLARQGKCPKMRERQVHIYSITQLARDRERLSLEICCSSGTYIRSLARDLGEALGCGGCLAGLRRTRIGNFTVENAYSFDAPGGAREIGYPGEDALRAKVLSLADYLGEERLLPVTEAEAKHVSHGLIPHTLEARLQDYSGDLVGFLYASAYLPAVLRREQSAWRWVFTQDIFAFEV